VSITIYHNPKCTTSNNVLAAIRAKGLEPTIIEYLKNPPSRTKLKAMLKAMNFAPRDILRRSGTPYDELGLDNPDLSDEAILDYIEAHPILIQRPIVESPKGVKLCRPSELINDLL
jgi:arsenate reductase (glutaredoxin)